MNSGASHMSVTTFADGSEIQLPEKSRHVSTRGHGHYLMIDRTDDFFIKRPTSYHFQVLSVAFPRSWGFLGRLMHRLFGGARITAIRDALYEESIDNLPQLCKRFPELANTNTIAEYRYFLALYKLQHERLRALFGKGIPDAAFVLVVGNHNSRSDPAVVQQAIHGHSLWDMVDHQSALLLPQWKHVQRPIAEQLSSYIESEFIDCNIDNFFFSEESSTLHYVDCKPTFVSTRRVNEHNKRIMKEYLIARV